MTKEEELRLWEVVNSYIKFKNGEVVHGSTDIIGEVNLLIFDHSNQALTKGFKSGSKRKAEELEEQVGEKVLKDILDYLKWYSPYWKEWN